MEKNPQWPWIIYQIFPDRFCRSPKNQGNKKLASWSDLPTRSNFFGGDLAGIQEKLDYLQNLGVNAIYLNPVFKAHTNHRYDTEDYYEVDALLGGNSALQHLIKSLHQRGMKIILDGVFNHCGDHFFAFQDLKKAGQESNYIDWFHVNHFPIETKPLSYMTCGGAEYLPKLNYANREVREYILHAATYWLEEYGIDGWRLDVPFKVPFDFWEELNKVTKAANPEVFLVGEIWKEPFAWVSGGVFDSATNYPLRNLLLEFVSSQFLDSEDFDYETSEFSKLLGDADSSMLNLLGSHDTTRILTVLKGDAKKLKIALTYLFTNPGIPMIYYGDEIGLLGESDPDCRRPMPWQEEEWNQQVLSIYRNLIRLRQSYPLFWHGKKRKLFCFNGVYIYAIEHGVESAIVVLNPRETVHHVHVKTGIRCQRWVEFNSSAGMDGSDGMLHFDQIPTDSAWVFLPEKP
ncbi:MAG: glycoside hydrolase family 13 protein [Anaerolineaceae bacterium]|nr:glycoside hydrolase family 13 protein [Anaerolineaceae bacterium]